MAGVKGLSENENVASLTQVQAGSVFPTILSQVWAMAIIDELFIAQSSQLSSVGESSMTSSRLLAF